MERNVHIVCGGGADERSPSHSFEERNDGVILIDTMLFEQEWFSELPLKNRLLYIYLLGKASKVGIFEVNLRRMSYDINADDGSPVTEDDLFKTYGKRIVKIADKKGLIVDYISFNWMRGKPLDPKRNPLHRGLEQELARHGLTFADINRMSTKHNLRWDGMSGDGGGSSMSLDEMFNGFWEAYPSSCPRKVDKKKCMDKFMRVMASSSDIDALYKSMLDGLSIWKECDTWCKDGGRFIMAPLRWLNGMCWNDRPAKKGAVSDGNSGCCRKASIFLDGTVESADSF